MRIQDVVDELQKVIPDKRVSIRLTCSDGTIHETEVFEVIANEDGNLVMSGLGQLVTPSSNAESEVY